MKIKLVSCSRPSKELQEQGITNTQELIAYCARVSNPSNQYNVETSEKLIKYLLKHKHFSPLEMSSACLEITTTRDIARQMLRHRSFLSKSLVSVMLTQLKNLILFIVKLVYKILKIVRIVLKLKIIIYKKDGKKNKHQSFFVLNRLINGLLIMVLQKNKHELYYLKELQNQKFICKGHLDHGCTT